MGPLQQNIITQLRGSTGENIRPIDSYEDYAVFTLIIDGCNLFKCHDGTICNNADKADADIYWDAKVGVKGLRYKLF